MIRRWAQRRAVDTIALLVGHLLDRDAERDITDRTYPHA